MLCRPILSTSSFDFLWKSLSFNSTMGLKLHIGIVITLGNSFFHLRVVHLLLALAFKNKNVKFKYRMHPEIKKNNILNRRSKCRKKLDFKLLMHSEMKKYSK